MGSRHHSKDALEYHRQNSIFLAKLHKTMLEELSHKNQYIEKLEAEVRRLSTTLDQLENEKMMSQKMTNDNIKVGKILEESADSDTDGLGDLEVSACSESTSIGIVEAIKSNSNDLSEADESQEFSEFDDTNYEPDRKKSKSELTVKEDEAASDSLNIVVASSQSSSHDSFDGNDGEDVSMEVVPFSNNHSKHGYPPFNDDPNRTFFNQMNQFAAPLIVVKNLNVSIPSVNTSKTRISRSKLSRSKITQEQKSKVSGKAFSSPEPNPAANSEDEAPSNQDKRYKYVIIRKPAQRRRNINEESQEEGSDSDASLESSSSNSGHSASEEDGNQEGSKSKNGNQVNSIVSKKRKTDSRSWLRQGGAGPLTLRHLTPRPLTPRPLTPKTVDPKDC